MRETEVLERAFAMPLFSGPLTSRSIFGLILGSFDPRVHGGRDDVRYAAPFPSRIRDRPRAAIAARHHPHRALTTALWRGFPHFSLRILSQVNARP